MKTDFYAVLGIDRSATEAEMRRRFHELARRHHPDRVDDADRAAAESQFQAITEAFNALSNPERRRSHDQELAAGRSGSDNEGERRARAYLARGVEAFREGRLQQAVEAFQKATEADPSNARAWHHLATICAKDPRRRERAIEAIREACRLDSVNAEYHKLAAKLLDAHGLTSEAEKFYNLALRWGGPDADVELALARLQERE